MIWEKGIRNDEEILARREWWGKFLGFFESGECWQLKE